MRKNERSNFDRSRYRHCGGSHPIKKKIKNHRKERVYKKQPFNPWSSNNKCNECNACKLNNFFRCGPEDHFIAIFQNRTIRIRKFTGTLKSQKLMRAYQIK